MTAYIYSVAPASGAYILYAPKPAGQNNIPRRVLKRVIVNGGSGVAHSQSMNSENFNPDNPIQGLFTPRGVLTTVSDEDMEFLKENSAFMHAVENKWIAFEEGKKVSIERKLNVLDENTANGPLTPSGLLQDSNGNPIDKRVQVKKAGYSGVVAQPLSR